MLAGMSADHWAESMAASWVVVKVENLADRKVGDLAVKLDGSMVDLKAVLLEQL